MNTTDPSTAVAGRPASREFEFHPRPGFLMLTIVFLLPFVSVVLFAMGGAAIALGVLCWLAFFFIVPGFFLVNPNDSRALVLFGTYRGTARKAGFWWTNPFT